jgi:hypothetical protein
MTWHNEAAPVLSPSILSPLSLVLRYFVTTRLTSISSEGRSMFEYH